MDFVYTVSDNENKIDLVDVLEWYKHLLEKESETELTKRIHKFAEEYLTWEEQLKPVVNYIKEETDEYIPKNTCKSFS